MDEFWICRKTILREETLFRTKKKRVVFSPVVKIGEGESINLTEIGSGNKWGEFDLFLKKVKIWQNQNGKKT